VPTPTTPQGFDLSIVKSALSGVGKGKIAVIKSTMVPGSTVKLQEEFPEIVVLYSPEFLSEATASYDAAHPFSNIAGMPEATARHKLAAEAVLSVLPEAAFAQICSSTEAEIVKYSHNASAYAQIMMFNVMYDVARAKGFEWDNIREAVEADPFISSRYARPIHKTGRGAGGHCFIKDMAALRETYENLAPQDKAGSAFLRALEAKNMQLLRTSGKDLDLLRGVYGEA
jgi:UDPglucose 6-dehydrogenase